MGTHSISRARGTVALAVLLLGALRTAPANTGEVKVSIEPLERWSNFFADTEQPLTFLVTSDGPLPANLVWRYAAGQRTIARGEAPLKADADGPAKAEIRLKLPPVREGIIFLTELHITVAADGDKPAAELSRPIWLFPKNAFVDQSQWLEKLTIQLFDPEEKTEDRFDKEEIPYRRLRNLAAVDGVESGLVIVGEGVSLEDNRQLAESLAARAAAGVKVLCLALADGHVPTAAFTGESASSIAWRRSDVICELDKRLDCRDWAPKNGVPAKGLTSIVDGDELVAEVGADAKAWPWLEVRYEKQPGVFLYCGFSVIETWDAGPTPRYLFASMLRRLDESSQPASPDPSNAKE